MSRAQSKPAKPLDPDDGFEVDRRADPGQTVIVFDNGRGRAGIVHKDRAGRVVQRASWSHDDLENVRVVTLDRPRLGGVTGRGKKGRTTSRKRTPSRGSPDDDSGGDPEPSDPPSAPARCGEAQPKRPGKPYGPVSPRTRGTTPTSGSERPTERPAEATLKPREDWRPARSVPPPPAPYYVTSAPRLLYSFLFDLMDQPGFAEDMAKLQQVADWMGGGWRT
jgi:hypothetical protein